MKTNRRDATSLAKLSRAGELTAVWVPDERHEAMRDLSRARQAAKKDLQGKRQQISSLMLRLGCHYPGKKTWGPAHMNWLMAQKLEHREQRIVLEELLEGVRQESERVERLEHAIRETVPEWSLAEVRALPVTRPQRQAADGRRHGICPRAIGLHLGDQSRSHESSTGVTSPGACGLLGPSETLDRPTARKSQPASAPVAA